MSGSTLYPAAIDDATKLPDIGPSDQENGTGLYHDVVHSNAHAAIKAIEAKIGIDSSTDHASVDWKLGDARSRLSTAETTLTAKADLVSGKVPSSQLPSYVDDVLEFANYASLPGTGETGKIYITLDTNYEYRWSGSAYIQIVSSPGTTDALAEGSTNLYFTAARVLAVVLTGLSLATNAAITATDSILGALGKLQKQITDLTSTVSGKVTANAAITGATKTKITYGTNGLVTGGADATTADIADSANKRYVTDAELAVLAATSGTNTGDQTNITGNAGTATKLATARNINGQPFDGTADITISAGGGGTLADLAAIGVFTSWR